MKELKLLDCTLRDGGYYTNWEFDTQMVRDLVTNLDLSQVDISMDVNQLLELLDYNIEIEV